MSYHVVVPRFGFKELPDRVLVREDGAYGDHKAHGTPLINYWYVLEQRMPPTEREIISAHLEQLEADNAKLLELVEDMLDCIQIRAAFSRPPTEEMYEMFYKRARELGVDE